MNSTRPYICYNGDWPSDRSPSHTYRSSTTGGTCHIYPIRFMTPAILMVLLPWEYFADVFKAAAKNPEQILFVINGKVDEWEGRIGTINKPTSKEISAKSNLAQFKQRYEQFPKIGMQVDVIANNEGFWKLDLWTLPDLLLFYSQFIQIELAYTFQEGSICFYPHSVLWTHFLRTCLHPWIC